MPSQAPCAPGSHPNTVKQIQSANPITLPAELFTLLLVFTLAGTLSLQNRSINPYDKGGNITARKVPTRSLNCSGEQEPLQGIENDRSQNSSKKYSGQCRRATEVEYIAKNRPAVALSKGGSMMVTNLKLYIMPQSDSCQFSQRSPNQSRHTPPRRPTRPDNLKM